MNIRSRKRSRSPNDLDPGVDCRDAAHTQNASSKESPSPSDTFQDNDSPEEERSDHGLELSRYQRALPSPLPVIDRPLFDLPLEVSRVSPDMTSSMLLSMASTFERTRLTVGTRFDLSILKLCLPIIVQNPPLLHAWVSCGAMATSGSSPSQRQRGLVHYHHAIRGLSNVLQNDCFTDPEWKLSTVLLLHIFEEYQVPDDYTAPVTHLKGVHHLLRLSLQSTQTNPCSVHSLLLTEGVIFRTVVNSIFQPEPSLPFDHVEQLLIYLSTAKRHLGQASWRSSPWIGVAGDLFDIAFKLSWLRQRIPLDEACRGLLVRLQERLESCPLSDLATKSDLPGDVVETARLFHMGCTLLFLFIEHTSVTFSLSTIANSDSRLFPPFYVPPNLALDARSRLSNLAASRTLCVTHLWPLILFAISASTEADQAIYTDILKQCSWNCGQGTIARIKRLLFHTWNDGIGTGVLLRDDLLSSIIL